MSPTTPTNPWNDLFKKKKWGIYPSEMVVREVASLDTRQQFPRALDLGCGAGAHTMLLADQGYYVTAVDGSREALHQAEVNCLRQHVDDRVTYVEADYIADKSGPWRPATAGYDVILDWLSLAHQQKARIASEFRCWFPLLRQGGAYIVGLFGDASSKDTFADVPMPALFSLMDVRLMCQEAILGTRVKSFTVEEQTYTRKGNRVQVWCVVFRRSEYVGL